MKKKRYKKVAVVACNGGSPRKPELEGVTLTGNCQELQEAYPEGIYECKYGCLGGGSCVAACKFGAITIDENNIARVDREKCTGCTLCVKACPQNIIHMALTENVILMKCSNREPGPVARKQCDVSCIACRICEINCPCDAIHVVDNVAVITQHRCVACGMCAVKCPRVCILDADGLFTDKE